MKLETSRALREVKAEVLDKQDVKRKDRHELTPTDVYERVKFILDGMARGRRDADIREDFIKHFDLSYVTIHSKERSYQLWRNKAEKALAKWAVGDIDKVRQKQMMRLDYLLEKLIEREDYRGAKEVIETQNKLMNLYDKGTVILPIMTEFKFGEGFEPNFVISGDTSSNAVVVDTEATSEDISFDINGEN